PTMGLAREPGKKYPAVLIVPGGYGQPAAQWVQTFARHGYAALSMDIGGNWQPDPQKPAERNPNGGPPADDNTRFRLPNVANDDTWMYHAVADVILARSLLRVVPDVDQEHVGVTGSGWGGYVTCIVAALDARFQAAAPGFACGFLEAHSFW